MDNKEILINNKIIAVFMGGLLNGEGRLSMPSNEIWLPLHGQCRFDTIDIGRGKTLHYHKSWDWVMPVIEKNTEPDLVDFIDIDLFLVEQQIITITKALVDNDMAY